MHCLTRLPRQGYLGLYTKIEFARCLYQAHFRNRYCGACDRSVIGILRSRGSLGFSLQKKMIRANSCGQRALIAQVWLCSPCGHPTMARLGGVLGMTAPTWWWSPARPHWARAHVCSAPETRALMDLTGRAAKCRFFDCAWSLLDHGVAERRRCDLGNLNPD